MFARVTILPINTPRLASPYSLGVFVPLQRAGRSWTAASPHHSPPQQAAENNPRIPAAAAAAAAAAYRLWAGEHVGSINTALLSF